MECVTSNVIKNSDVKELIIDDEKNTNGDWVKAFCRNFYSSASENDKPYVEVGQKCVDKALYIEAMKVTNEIVRQKTDNWKLKPKTVIWWSLMKSLFL